MKYSHLGCRNSFLVIIPEIMNASNKIHGSSSRNIHNLTSFYGKVPKSWRKHTRCTACHGYLKQHTKSHLLGAQNFIIHQCPLYTMTHWLQRANCKELGRAAIYGPVFSSKWTSRQEIEGIGFSHLYVQLSNDRSNQSLLRWRKHGINHLMWIVLQFFAGCTVDCFIL